MPDLESIRKPPLTSETCAKLVRQFGGVDDFVKFFYDQTVHAAIAKPGGKTVIDATNPIAEAPPVNGVLRLFTSLDESLMERLQRRAPAARRSGTRCRSCSHRFRPNRSATSRARSTSS